MPEQKTDYTVTNMAEKFDELTEKVKELEQKLAFKEQCLKNAMQYQDGYADAIKDIISQVITELRPE